MASTVVKGTVVVVTLLLLVEVADVLPDFA
jgi:hypothetical protein